MNSKHSHPLIYLRGVQRAVARDLQIKHLFDCGWNETKKEEFNEVNVQNVQLQKTKETQQSSTFPVEVDDSDKDSVIINNGNNVPDKQSIILLYSDQ